MRRCVVLVAVLAGLLAPTGCIEIQKLAASMSAANNNANANSAPDNVNANDNSANANDNTNDNSASTNDNANGNDNTNQPDNSVGPTPPPDNSSNDNTNANDNTNTNDNANANDNSDTNGLPPLPDDAALTTTETGLQYYDFELGDGAQPTMSDSVIVHYTGYLPDGTIFDENYNARFQLTRVVPGFSEGILGMKVGGKRRLYIPPDLGYGPDGNAAAGIGGEDIIVFDVRLKGISGLPNYGVAQ